MRSVNRTVLFIVLLASAFLASRVAGQSAPISEADYWALIEQTRTGLRSLDGKSPEEARIALDGLAGLWSGLSEVEREDGTRVPVDVSYLVEALKSDSTDPKLLAGQLDELLKAREAHPQNVYGISDLNPLHQILLADEFQWKISPVAEWFQNLWDKFAAWLDSLFPDRENTGNGNGVEVAISPDLLAFVAVLLLLGILAFVFRGLFTDLVSEVNLGEAGEDDDRQLTSETAFRKAQTLSGKGDYRAGVRYLYLSSLLLLEERGVLRYDRSRTNREYLRSVSEHPNLAKPLKSVVDVFDRTWYGFEPLDESTYKEYVDEVEELKEQKE